MGALHTGIPARGEIPARAAAPETATATGPGPLIASCRALEDEAVVDRDGASVGRIARFVIHPASGRVVHVIVACGGVLGIGERLCAVPWRQLVPDVQRRCFVLDADPSLLQGAARR